MGIKVIVNSTSPNRVSINNQQRTTIRTVAVSSVSASDQALSVARQAYDRANNAVIRSGDTMTGSLSFNSQNTAVGNILDGRAIELFAGGDALWAELNYANNNFVWVDAQGSYMSASGNDSPFISLTDGRIGLSVGGDQWNLGSNGEFVFPDGSTQNTAFSNKIDGGNF